MTRGAISQDPLHGTRVEPNAFLTATQLEPYPAEYYEKGLTAVLLDEQKLNPYDSQAGHKTLDYFSRLAGLREANRRGAALLPATAVAPSWSATPVNWKPRWAS